MTLTEVLIALALMALVAGPLYSSIRAAFVRDAVEQQRADREAQLRLVSSLIADDIRSGAPSNKRAGAASQELSLEFVDDRGDLQRVFWVLVGGELRRQELDGATSSVRSDTVFLDRVETDGPLFRYWGADGREITDADTIASCAVRVSVDLVLASTNGDVSQRTFDVAHRIPNSEAEPCAP